MARRRRYEPPIKKTSTFGLNITSMTDMFTMLLVFLLQTYSTSDVEIIPSKDLRLPSSASNVNPTLGLKVAFSENDIKIDDKVIVTLKSRDFKRDDIDPHDSNFITPLFNELQARMKASEQLDVDSDAYKKDPVKDGKILLQADRSLNYGLLRKVMYTASMAGFPQLKLVTTVGN